MREGRRVLGNKNARHGAMAGYAIVGVSALPAAVRVSQYTTNKHGNGYGYTSR
jgi:hypothetical protein